MAEITIDTLSVTFQIDPGEVERWIAKDWLRPDGEPGHWHFTDIDVARLRLIHELRHDIGVEEGGLPVVLRLMDQLYESRRQLRRVREALNSVPDEARNPFLDFLRQSGMG